MIKYWLTNIIHQNIIQHVIPNIVIASTLLIQPFVVRQIDSFKIECVWTVRIFYFNVLKSTFLIPKKCLDTKYEFIA